MKKNIRKQFEEGGVKPVNIVKRIKVKANAIQMARDIFPSCYFHKGRDEGPDQECDGFVECAPKDLNTRAKRAEKGMEALSNYRYVYNDDDSVYRETPHHDWASNGADAFQQFAQGYKQEKEWEPLKISTRGIV
jgi:hypothetical protein